MMMMTYNFSLCRNDHLPRHASDDLRLTRSLFCKETLPELEKTFWDWFESDLQLTSAHLKPLWTAGHVMGFVARASAEEKLMGGAAWLLPAQVLRHHARRSVHLLPGGTR